MGQPEGMHLVSERTEGLISPQVLESSMNMEKKGVPQEQLSGISKPPIKHVFKRRAKKQQVTDEEINKSPSNKMDDKGMGQESSNARMIGASEMERKRELNMEKMALMAINKKPEEVGACREKEENSFTLAATAINSKEKKISEDSSKTERIQFTNTRTIIGEDRFKGIPKPPVKHVYKRRGKKPEVTEAINKSPSKSG